MLVPILASKAYIKSPQKSHFSRRKAIIKCFQKNITLGGCDEEFLWEKDCYTRHLFLHRSCSMVFADSFRSESKSLATLEYFSLYDLRDYYKTCPDGSDGFSRDDADYTYGHVEF